MQPFNFCLAAGLACAALSSHAAPTVLDTGLVRMGLTDYGRLGALDVGFSGPGGDAILVGCPCEGWGASANHQTGYSYGVSGESGIISGNTSAAITTGASLSATNITTLANGLQVTHRYASAAGGKLFEVAVTLANRTAGTLNDVRYARTIDWDVAPGYFDGNYTTVYRGTPAAPGSMRTSTSPFLEPDPLAYRSEEANVNVTDSVGDKGSYFAFSFGDLAPGASVSFGTYIGADTSVSGLLNAMTSVGVEAYSYTTGNQAGTDGYSHAPAYGYGFVGLGLLSPVPEPSRITMLGLGLALVLLALRRRA
jgi:hypothetical protein